MRRCQSKRRLRESPSPLWISVTLRSLPIFSPSVGSISCSASLQPAGLRPQLFPANQVFLPRSPWRHSVFILVSFIQPSPERPAGRSHQPGESAHGFGTCFETICDFKLFDVAFVWTVVLLSLLPSPVCARLVGVHLSVLISWPSAPIS